MLMRHCSIRSSLIWRFLREARSIEGNEQQQQAVEGASLPRSTLLPRQMYREDPQGGRVWQAV